MENETKEEEGLSRRTFLIGLGGGVIGAAALASGATPERKYIGANTSWVDFGEGTRAFLTQPQQGKEPFRAVILGHERYGLVQHTLDLAAKFAAYGYMCVAPDMASHWKGDKAALNRGEERLTLTPDQIKYYMGKGLDYLLTQSQVDKTRIAAMGVCQSGDYPLLLNSVRKEVAANLVFYGGVNIGEEVIANLSAPVLVSSRKKTTPSHWMPCTSSERTWKEKERVMTLRYSQRCPTAGSTTRCRADTGRRKQRRLGQ